MTGLRYDNFKYVFMEQRAEGTFRIWAEPFVTLRAPKVFNLRTDPYERADITSNTYFDWAIDHGFQLWCLHRRTWPITCRASRNTLKARKPLPSTWMRLWRR
jgi:hypothetical protein